ncbi:MAG TPA: hypothetical protein VNA11_05630 [Pseudonocardia sp.]|jgi:hypothetical protein|nr:hypothetical protein [Pseudonocardia sp.]
MPDVPDTGTPTRDTRAPDTDPGAAVVGYARLTGLLGIVFAVLLTIGLVLIHRSPALDVSESDYTVFYRDGGQTIVVTVGLYLVPFAGIAFLWHLTTVRLLVRALTPAPSVIPFALQAVAGALFVGLLFAGTAAAGAVALLQDLNDGPLPDVNVGRALAGVGYAMVFVYATRMAGMYAITTTTLLLHAGLLPRWVALLSYLMATVMLVATTFNPAVVLVFPGWVALTGLIVLMRTGRSGAPMTPRSRP